MNAAAPDSDVRDGLDAVVTLVPGTWARKAAWTRADSRLSSALTTDGCKVVPFEWSHSNCHRARMRAALRLAEQIQGQIKENPGARHWVVAHSHGGNIALHAVGHLRRSYTDAPRVSTVTLATPFIHACPRALSGWSVFVLALFGAMVVGLAGTTLAEGLHWRDWSFYVSALVVGEALLCIVGAGMHWGFLKGGNLRWLRRRFSENPVGWWADVIAAVMRGKFIRSGYRSRVIASVHSPTVEPADVFVVRAAGDEASTGLAAGQFLGWISGLLNPLLTNIWVWAGIILTTQVSVLFAPMVDRADLGFSIMIYVFAVPGLVAMAAFLVMLAAAVPFGWDGPFLSIFASCSAEAAPPGRATILQLAPFAGVDKSGLAHSRLYWNKSVIDEIVKLICGSSPTAAAVVEPSGSSEDRTRSVGQSGHPEPRIPSRRRTQGRKRRR